MKTHFLVVAIASLLSLSTLSIAAPSYKEELKALAQSKTHAMVFDEDGHDGLKSIARDIESYPKLSQFQRNILAAFEIVIVTPETMPTLHGYIDDVCKQNSMKMPTVFIATNPGFLNAFALKLFWGTGIIVIGKKMIEEASDDELNGVLAHEIGHIRYDHGTKKFVIFIGSVIATSAATHALTDNQIIRSVLPIFAGSTLASLVVNKRFEREADEFAYKTMGQGKGLKSFFQRLEQREQKTEQDFAFTSSMLHEHKDTLAFFDYVSLLMRYYMVKGGHKLGNAYKWVYHNTFLGDHPSHIDRIQAIENHLAKQA